MAGRLGQRTSQRAEHAPCGFYGPAGRDGEREGEIWEGRCEI